MINRIEIRVFIVIFSFRRKKDNMGTKTYPNDSNIGISFRLTPCLIAVILINSEHEKYTYANITLQLYSEKKKFLCSMPALLFNRI